MNIYENTIVIFKVDHNTEPGKGTCYQHGIHIPFLMQWPKVIKAATVVEALAMNTDFVPTVFDCCGITPPAEMPLDGVSMLPLLKGTGREIHKELFFEFGYARAVLAGKWKYIALRYPRWLIDDMTQGVLHEAPNHINQRMQGQMNVAIETYPAYFDPDQLYDIEVDPDEQYNLAGEAEYTHVWADMRQRLSRIVATFEHPFDLDVPDFMRSDHYRKLCDATRKIGTDYLYWWPKEQWW